MPDDHRDAQLWQLRQGGEVVARIRVHGVDQPWFAGRFEPEPGFVELAPLFQREVELVDAAGDLDVDAWEAVQAQICQTVGLVKPDGQEVADFILHIRGGEASFRWSDEALDE
ncbi:hypothetical protein E1211_02590 [Micromonospora sp. 15K316]|uniref:hypothetical protein n=1 Tax=Micromonospora sp. 15K316 TaxID=2530376 RepID=UPI0010459341|nr:hypothetical protein [Micromonospora sp. 15K316]TDC39899.1 hypothetical protein E1211_02590 [Micromonospora sp. 15K316]